MKNSRLQIVTHPITVMLQYIWKKIRKYVFGETPDQLPTLRRLVRAHGATYDHLASNTPYLSIFSYKSKAVQQAIWQYKFKNNRIYARRFAELVHDAAYERICDWQAMRGVDQVIMTGIPSHPASIRRRGFDHIDLFVSELSDIMNDPYITYHPNILLKIKNTPRQSHHANRKKRLTSQSHAFILSPHYSGKCNGKSIILVDDVYTTGATLQAATDVLQSAGAARVIWLTVAH